MQIRKKTGISVGTFSLWWRQQKNNDVANIWLWHFVQKRWMTCWQKQQTSTICQSREQGVGGGRGSLAWWSIKYNKSKTLSPTPTFCIRKMIYPSNTVTSYLYFSLSVWYSTLRYISNEHNMISTY